MFRRLAILFLSLLALTACLSEPGAPTAAPGRIPTIASTAPVTLSPQPAPSIYEDNLHLFDYDMNSALTVTENSVQPEAGYAIHDISYPSPKCGDVTAYVLIPDGEGPHAGIIFMHGSSGSRESLLPFAEDLVVTGAVAMTIDGPAARLPGRSWLTFTHKDRDEQIQLIVDLRRAVDVLIQYAHADPERIGYIGYSYGAAMGGLLAGVEHRIKAYGLMVGDGGLVTHFLEGGEPVGGFETIPAGMRKAWLEAMEPIDSIHYVGHAAPSALFFQNARYDSLVTETDALAYQVTGSEPKKVEWYDSGHGLPSQAYFDMVNWLAEQIAIDASKYQGPSQ